MSNSLYNSARTSLINGVINWITDDIRVIPVSSSYVVDLASHVYLSDIPGAARLAGAQPLTGRLIVGGAASGDTTTFLSITNVDVQAIFIYKHTTVENTSNLIAYLDTAVGLPLHVSNGLIIHWETGPSKIFTMPSGGLVSSVAGRVGDILLTAADISGLPAAYTLPTASTSVLGGVKVDGTTITISGGVISGANTYSLPVASASTLGGIKVGAGLSIDGAGILTAAGAVSSVAGRTGDVVLTYSDIGGLALVASSGSYNNLTSTPIQQTAQGTVADPDSGDPYWANTTLLLGMDGTSGSTTFVDSKGSKTVTVAGSSQISNVRQKFTGNNVLSVPGSSYIQVPNSTDWTLGSQDFTIELWFSPNSVTPAAQWWGLVTQRSNNTSNHAWSLYLNPSNAGLGFSYSFDGFTAPAVSYGITFVVGTWYHIAVVRSGGTNLNIAVNGVFQNNTIAATSLYTSPLGIQIGSLDWNNTSTTQTAIGYIDDVRITKGVARYTANFTPPQSSLLAGQSDPFWANTLLLLHMDGTNNSTSIIDAAKSTTITTLGNAKLSTARSMFGTSSAIFAGTGDYMTMPAATFSPGTGDFTVECWVYKTAWTGSGVTNDETIFGCGSSAGNILFYITNGNGQPRTWDGTNGYGGSSNVALNSWHHVAWVRSAGVLYIFLDGVLGYSGAYTYNIAPTNTWKIGGNMLADGTRWFTGNMDELRVSNRARYTANFTPNATQFLSGNTDTQWNNVLALLHFEGVDGSTTITDTKGGVAWTTVGAAQISTAQKKLGTSSLSTTGSTQDYVRTNSTTNAFGLLSSDLATVELWVYPTTTPTTSGAYLVNNQGQYGNNYINWALAQNLSTGYVSFSVGDANGTSVFQTVAVTGVGLALNTWTHVALTKNGTAVTIWLNGVSAATGTISVTMGTRSDRYLSLGGELSDPANAGIFRGYIDEFRFTKNVVRYAAAFTPNVSAFPDGMATPGSVQYNKKGSLQGSPLLVWDELNNRLGVGVANPTSNVDVSGTIGASSLILATSNANQGFRHTPGGDGTGWANMELGSGRAGNGYAYVDLVGDTTYTDYGLRLIRNNTGANATSELAHRGTGDFYITAVDGARLLVQTTSVVRGGWTAGGNHFLGSTTDTLTRTLGVTGQAQVTDRLRVGSTSTTNIDASLSVEGANGGFNRCTQIQGSGYSLNIMYGAANWFSWGVDASNRWNISPNATTFGTSGLMMNTSGEIGIGGVPVAGYRQYSYGNTAVKLDQNARSWALVDNQTAGTSSQAEFTANCSGSLYSSYGIFPASNTNGGSGGVYWSGIGGAYFHTNAAVLGIGTAGANPVQILTGGSSITNIRARWSGTGNLALGYGDTTNATEKLQLKAGNFWLDGTAGTHGIIFPDGSKQYYAANPYTLPTASTSVLGGVKVDGASINISSGVINASNMVGTNLTVKWDQATQSFIKNENLSAANQAQASLYLNSNSGFCNMGSVGTGWGVASGGAWEVLNGGSGVIAVSSTKFSIGMTDPAGVINVLTGGVTNSNIRARWSASGNLALGYGDLTDATEKLQLKAGNFKLDGTAGTHGIIFPDATKQTTAGQTAAQVNAAIQAVVGAAPAALDTLNELAAALGNDANFASSMTTLLGTKANTSSLATVATSGQYSDLIGAPTGSSLTYLETFTNADLVTGVLTVTHGLGSKYCIVNVYDDLDRMIIPDEVTAVNSSNLTVDLTSFGTLTGTWHARVMT